MSSLPDPLRLYQDRVSERDLDNFLVEELHASEPFRSWFLSRLRSAFDEPKGCEVRLQKSPPRLQDNRQTDVRLGWFSRDGALRGCILIESKVTADFQPGQAEAYAAEAADYKNALGARAIATALVAPRARLASLVHDGFFDAAIALEDIIDSLEQRLRQEQLSPELVSRLNARIDLLETICGKKSVSRWTPVTIEAKRDFAVAYSALAAEIVPDLMVRPSTDGPKAITRIFEGLNLAPDFPGAVLRHEFGARVPIKYANVLLRGLASRLPALRDNGILKGTSYQPAEAGQSLAIRVATPGVDPTLPFEREREKVLTGLEAIRDLAAWVATNKASLAKILLPSSPVAAASPVRCSTTDPQERAFTEALWETFRECEKLGYRPTGMLQMIERLGGIGAARQLLSKPPSEGFARLAELGRLDLAIESLVQQPRWQGLFSEDELRVARRRLR